MSTTEPTPKPTIGRIVHYRQAQDSTTPGIGGDYHIAAIVTMTPDEWTPGYRDAEGEWHDTPNSPQPKAGCVHLHLFPPPITGGTTWTEYDVKDVPYGDGPGSWSYPPRV